MTKRRAHSVALAGLCALALVVGLRLTIRYVPSAGPALANSLRAVLEAGAVTRLEELTAVVAVLASDVRLYAVPGTVEPEATTPEGSAHRRQGPSDRDFFYLTRRDG